MGCLKGLLLTSAALGVIATAAPAGAAETAATKTDVAGATSVEAMVVTARRRPEQLFDVAAPVTVISADTIKLFDIGDMKGMMQMVPNAVLPKSPDNYLQFINIRGIQETDVQAQPNFGTYRNGIYGGGERPNFGPLVDVERVEVNAGPQAGLYGRDSVGGAINVIYATPGDKFGGYLTSSYARYDRTEIKGAVNLPVSDTLKLRLAGWYQNQNKGEWYNATLGTYVDANSEQGGRLSAKWTPTKDLSVVWMVEYSQNTGPSTEAYAPHGILNGVIRGAVEQPNVIYRNTPDRNKNGEFYFSQDVTYKTGWGTFEWLASVSDYHMNDIEDEDKTALDPTYYPLAVTNALRRKEEVRNVYTELLWFSPADRPLTVTAGVSYFDQKFAFQRQYDIALNLSLLSGPYAAYGSGACAALLYSAACPGVPGGAFPALGVQDAVVYGPGGGTTIGTQSYSGFAEATYHFNSMWSVTAAVRYTDDEEHLNFHQFGVPGSSPGAPWILALLANLYPNIDLVGTYPFRNTSPSVQLNFKPNSSLNFYALYSTGFRAGGFNTVTTTASLIPYGSEKATNYEVGAKTLWLNDHLGVNLGFFYMTQDNLLTYEPDPVAPPQYGFYYLANVGSAETYGVELTTVAKVNDWLTASVTAGWLHAKLTGGVSYGFSQAGQPLENTRTWTVDSRVQVRYPLPADLYLVGGVNWHVETGGYLDITTIAWPSYNKLDATIGIAKGKSSFELFIDNALDDRPPDFVYGNGATTLVDGQTYGLRLTLGF